MTEGGGRKRVFGRYDGMVEVDDSVFSPMSDYEVAELEDSPQGETRRTEVHRTDAE